MENWRLDAPSRRALRPGWGHDSPLRLVHEIVLSMPDGTPPEKLLAPSRNFARFTALHRYALALHTDERHPHVHLIRTKPSA